MQPEVNKWLDLLDRVGWTAVQAAIGALAAYFASGQDFDWSTALYFVLGATLAAVAKVVVGQNTGTDDTGSLIGQSVVEPPPTSDGQVP
jgi:hypothetical protein